MHWVRWSQNYHHVSGFDGIVNCTTMLVIYGYRMCTKGHKRCFKQLALIPQKLATFSCHIWNFSGMYIQMVSATQEVTWGSFSNSHPLQLLDRREWVSGNQKLSKMLVLQIRKYSSQKFSFMQIKIIKNLLLFKKCQCEGQKFFNFYVHFSLFEGFITMAKTYSSHILSTTKI